MNIGNRGFGGKKLSNKRRGKRGNKFVPLIISLIVVMLILYFFFYTKRTDPAVERIEATEETTELQTPTTTTAVASTPSATTPVIPTIIKKPVSEITVQDKAEISSLYQQANTALSQGDLLAAREQAQRIMNIVPENTKAWETAAGIVGQANVLIFKTDYVSPEKTKYIVRSGDTLDKIVKKFSTTLEAIQTSNNLPKTSSTIRLGQALNVYNGNWLVKINKSHYKLYLYNNNKLFKAYNIATGKGNKTPEGAFVIAAKIKEPEWTNNGVKYPFGDPQNVLGTRWMKLRAAATNPNKHLTGYGIHGTWQPNSIGKMASNGCIRMSNNDVEELFAIIPKYTNPNGNLVPVIIEK